MAKPNKPSDLAIRIERVRLRLAIVNPWPRVPSHLQPAFTAIVEAAANPGKVITKKAA